MWFIFLIDSKIKKEEERKKRKGKMKEREELRE